MWFRSIFSDVQLFLSGFKEKLGSLEVGFDVEFGEFLRNIDDSEKKNSEKFTGIPTFYSPLFAKFRV